MTKIALITDTHVGCRSDSQVFHDYFKRSFDFFFKELDSRLIDHIIHLGDLFDRRKYINFLTAKVCRETFLEPIQERGMDCHIILGNHDTFFKGTNEVNSLQEIVGERYEGIKVYSEPEIIDIDGLQIQLMPWINPSNSEKCHEVIKTTTAEVLMGHLELNGFEMFKGIISNHGDESNVFSKFDMVMSGHFHHKSSIGNIHYLGSFMEQTWSDWNDPKGFHIFDTETRELEFIENPHTIFKMIAYDDLDKDIFKEMDKIEYSSCKDSYIRIVCVNRTNPYAFDLMMERIYAEGPVDISIVEDFSNITDNTPDEEINQTQDTPTILSSYIKSLTLPVDSSKMIDYMNGIYAEALTIEDVDNR